MADSDESESRYDEILRKIAGRKPFGAESKPADPSPFDLILDFLNAYDTMDSLAQRAYSSILSYGPAVMRDTDWAGVVLWYHAKTYYGYRALNLLGIWVQQLETDLHVILGLRHLSYTAPVYTAEAYYALIRKGFKTYYDDNGHPPQVENEILYQAIYEQKIRLSLRDAIQTHLKQWKANLE